MNDRINLEHENIVLPVGVEDVTEEYFNNAHPGEGAISYEEGYSPNTKEHIKDVITATWMISTFGGTILMIAEKYAEKVPDCIWNNKYIEFKSVSSCTAVDKRMQKANKQLKNLNAEKGILIEISKYAENTVSHVIQVIAETGVKRCSSTMDIIIKKNNTLIRVIRIIK